jgi:hypothetical protein
MQGRNVRYKMYCFADIITFRVAFQCSTDQHYHHYSGNIGNHYNNKARHHVQTEFFSKRQSFFITIG